MTRVGLHMIVKNEAHVIERCLRSVLPLVDWWVVSDTGSTDGTQDVVRRVMAGVPGRLVEHPWVNFGHNRQLALDAAQSLPECGDGDVVLWIDADEEFVDLPARDGMSDWLCLPHDVDGIELEMRSGDVRYSRVAGLRAGRGWVWHEPLHEYPERPGAKVQRLDAPAVVRRAEGARSLDPDTYRKDADLLRAELERRPQDARTQFYLAQSLFDAGDVAQALEMYSQRAANRDGWESERALAFHRVGVCLERLGRPAAEVAAGYAQAWEEAPHRIEPLLALARIERERGHHHVAHALAERATTMLVPPPGELFVDVSAHRWRALDEYAVTCGWTGRLEEGLAAAREALRRAPDEVRLQENVAWFVARAGA